MPTQPFPEDFAWGVATSAFQIEGARAEDGKGDSIWDRFSDLGLLRDRGEVACDHYHRWEEDLDLLATLGARAYRFSVSWPRVIPDGDGAVNRAGLDFYRRLVEGLVERGIRPYLTLYHWDLPLALQDRGGWASRATVDAFSRYASVLAEQLGDVVRHWITQNEPWVSAMIGHLEGRFAPGIRDWATALAAGHHLLLSHGRATEAIRDRVEGASVGLAIDCRPVTPATESDEDVAAARHFDGFRNRWFFDPVFGRGYPDDMMRSYRDRDRIPHEFVEPGDLDLISTPVDFLGLNYYTTVTVGAGGEERDDPEGEQGPNPPAGFTEMGWRIDPGGLARYLVHLHETYEPASLIVTENGASYSDGPDSDRVVDDTRRIAYLEGHVGAVAEALEAGVPVDGYFVWSLMDNLEWLAGFSQRFGLIWVDEETKERIPKRSFEWYARLIAAGTLPVT